MEVKAVGVRETLRALKRVQPDLEAELRKNINEQVRELVKTARGFIPTDEIMRGWKPNTWGHRGWDPVKAKRGIKRENPTKRVSSRGFATAVAVSNLSAPGMIYELAGSKSRGNSPQGTQFIANIESHPGSLRTPLRRVVVRAGVEKGEETRQAVEDALQTAQRVTQRRLDTGRG